MTNTSGPTQTGLLAVLRRNAINRWFAAGAAVLVASVAAVFVARVVVVHPPTASSAETSVVQHVSAGALGVPAGWDKLTLDQKLDRTLSLDSDTAVLLVHVDLPSRSLLLPGAFPQGGLFSDYRAQILKAFTHRPAPTYAAGGIVTIRVPGGSRGGVTTVVEEAPTVAAPTDLYVVVRDQGVIAGGNAPSVIVASLKEDAFPVTKGVVSGDGSFLRLVETQAAFEQHLR